MIDGFATALGYCVLGALVFAGACAVLQVFWDGFRAATLALWACMVCKKQTGRYFCKGMVAWFFHNWLRLLGTPSQSFRIDGPFGYWKEWNDWKVYGQPLSSIYEDSSND